MAKALLVRGGGGEASDGGVDLGQGGHIFCCHDCCWWCLMGLDLGMVVDEACVKLCNDAG